MPFSAQQSRILRTPRATPAVGSAKVMAHLAHPVRTTVFSMVQRLYSEVLPSIFRQTPREKEQDSREIRKDSQRKELQKKQARDEARREIIRKRAESEPHRVMAGDLSIAFAAK
jgi:hypothetical protein